MNAMRIILALSVGMVLAAGASAGPQGGTNKGKGPHAIRGVVAAVQTVDAKDKGTSLGSITVKVHHGKKKKTDEDQAAVEKEFAIDAGTTFEKVVVAGKGQRNTEAAQFADVHKGDHVAIIAKKGPEHLALKVRIIVRQKKAARLK